MKYFAKINVLGILYALILVIQTELMGNIFRISRLTNIPIKDVRMTIGISMFLIFIVSTIIFVSLSSKYFNTGKLRHLLTILWIPYFLVLNYFLSSLIPMTDIDAPSPALGLILFGIFLAYPFYITLINFISTKNISD
jgi:hypothetical protein